MNLATIILPRLNILKVKFINETECELELMQKSSTITDINQIQAKLKKNITAIYIEGFGVLNKPRESFIAKQVIENQAEFLSNIDDNGSIWFVRFSLIDIIPEKPKFLLHVSCLPLTNNYDFTYDQLINLKLIFKANAESSLICQAAARHLVKPILALTFIILFCSYIYSNNEYANIEQNNSHIETLKTTTTKHNNRSDNLTKQLEKTNNYQYHKICTIISAATPSNITLNNLIINPIQKPLQQGKELQINTPTIIIKGVCDSINIATNYIDTLRANYFPNKVEMTNSQYNQKMTEYEFTITIKL